MAYYQVRCDLFTRPAAQARHRIVAMAGRRMKTASGFADARRAGTEHKIGEFALAECLALDGTFVLR